MTRLPPDVLNKYELHCIHYSLRLCQGKESRHDTDNIVNFLSLNNNDKNLLHLLHLFRYLLEIQISTSRVNIVINASCIYRIIHTHSLALGKGWNESDQGAVVIIIAGLLFFNVS